VIAVLASWPHSAMIKAPREALVSVQALWCEVLLQALTDGLNSPPARHAFRWADRDLHPRDYILVPNADFELVCDLAGADPDAVRRDFRVRLTQKDPTGPHEPWGHRRESSKPAAKPVPTYHHEGRSLTLREWAEVSGVSREVLMNRVNRYGWSIERALTEPLGRRMPKPSRSDRAQVERIAHRLSAVQARPANDVQQSPSDA
jgi:hypothetical protein